MDQEFEVEDDFKTEREPNAHPLSGEQQKLPFSLSPQSALIFKKNLCVVASEKFCEAKP